MDQHIAFTTVPDGRKVAYALAGSGPLLVCPPPWVSHLELDWALPPQRRFFEALAEGRTLVRYDDLGCGLSDRNRNDFSVQSGLVALEAVLRAVRADSFDLFATSMATFVASAWAATAPATVKRLVLYGGWVHGDRLVTPEVRDHLVGLVRGRWGLSSDLLADILMPDASPGIRAAYVDYQKQSASAEVASEALAHAYRVDMGGFVDAVQAPTLVLHRRNDRAAPLDQGELLARSIRGARLEVLEGRNHLAWLGDAEAVVREVRRFLLLPKRKYPAQPVLTSRQREVAALVADGLTNREIAQRLFIDERSAEGHVERIRNRLGVRSRSQVAAWWVASQN